jgi:hypothetical protein
MADVKISGLPASTLPLSGTEVLPIVQSGVTKQVTVSDLTSGRFANASSLSVGNTTDPGAGILSVSSGVRFPATQVPSANANTLDDYEEGTWTPTDLSGAGLTFTVDHAVYTKVGNLVTANAYITFPTTVSSANVSISLPFLAAYYDLGTAMSTLGNVYGCISVGGASAFTLRDNNLVSLTNASVSASQILISITYTV